jgi:hypothetical protein
MATGIYVIYLIINGFSSGGIEPALLLSITYLPLLFTLFLFVFDSIFDRILPSKEKKADDAYQVFIKQTTKKVNENLALSIEDFRRLRENEKFQKALYQAYQIYLNGENEDINYVFLEKKFKKDTNEYKALEIVVHEVKEMSENK